MQRLYEKVIGLTRTVLTSLHKDNAQNILLEGLPLYTSRDVCLQPNPDWDNPVI